MACTPVRGRMAAMERLLSSSNAMEPSSEEASHEKLAAQIIQKEMNEADEVNLLEEEDMHVFDWKPLTDPLHLVACKTCKKPIKASQYVAHAERCRSVSTSDDTGLELDGGSGHKRPPRKARKRVQTAHENQATGTGDQEIEPFDGDDTAASESANFDDSQTVKASSLGRELKKSSMSLDGSFAVDVTGVGPGSANHLEGAMSPSKRTKLLPVQSSLTSDTLDSMCGVTMESGMCCNGPLTCKLHLESSKRTVKGRSQLYDVLLEEQNVKLLQGNKRKCKEVHVIDIPAPLATKIYYPSRNQRLRGVLGQLYRESLTKENSNESSIPKSLVGDSGMQSGNIQILSPNNDLSDLMGQKKDLSIRSSMSSLRRSEQMLPPTSEIGHTIPNGHPSHMNFQNQYHEKKISRPHLPIEAGAAGIMRSRMLPTPYTYTGTTGTSMGSIQQPSGIVPVI